MSRRSINELNEAHCSSQLEYGTALTIKASRSSPPRRIALLLVVLTTAALGYSYVNTGGALTSGTIARTRRDAHQLALLPVNTAQPSKAQPKKRYAYVFYVTSDIYACAALQLIDRLVNHNAMDATQIDLVVLHTESVELEFINKMHQHMNTRTVQVEKIQATTKDDTWKDSLTKLRVFQDWGYERIVFLDSDAVPLTNLDHLFDLPSAPIYAPTAYWLPQPFFASTLMVVEPSNDVFNELMNWVHARGMSDEFDMDILNAFFAEKVKYLPGEYTVLNSDFRQSPTAPTKLFNTTSELKKHTKVVHFSCTPDGAYGKPWLWESHDLSFLEDEDVDPLFGELFEAYWRGEQALCH